MPPQTTGPKPLSIEPISNNNDESSDEPTFINASADRSLLTLKRTMLLSPDYYEDPVRRREWMRPYWLGSGLFMILLAFWILDSLKDPIFGQLVDGKLEIHQPPAKVFSVCTTLAIVCFLEYISNERQKQQRQEKERSHEDILSGGGQWSTMTYGRSQQFATAEDTAVSGSIFISIGVPYCIVFGIMAYLLQFHSTVVSSLSSKQQQAENAANASGTNVMTHETLWHVIGYIWYAAIESFGSIAVATFWSYVNSTLSLEDAEKYYGSIIGVAQLGAIIGSTMVTTHVWTPITLVILSCLVILLHIIAMRMYCHRFAPTTQHHEEPTFADTEEATVWSGVALILKHNYVLLILGVSCLYEVSLTCLNYQMTLLGWSRFEETPHEGMSFTQFMGHYGQLVNLFSLALSSLIFPALIRRFGLRQTLRIFPSLLLLVNFIAFGAIPGNLAVLFLSMSVLKAMTYSIHDPSKEILYLPTSNAIKFKSKFWIDVVGARIAKACGSSINRIAGSVDRSIRIASFPSLVTAIGLLYVCYQVGIEFDRLIASESIVGVTGFHATKREYNVVDEDGNLVDNEDDADIFEDPVTPDGRERI
ncbi:hypothetical protein MPSEU_000133600 [Mayamaea pseudoterrestris]|nr:hypothetical protein MPSEU_000133600 [Mayamaea pseudoterrestris]